MGVVVDTSVFVLGERRGWTAHRTIEIVFNLIPSQKLILPAVAAVELIEGVHRAQTPEQMERRLVYARDAIRAIEFASFTQNTAWIAGKMRGEQAQLGNTLPFADSLIAATALELDYAVLTLNVKDFARIPNLRVIPFALT